MNGARVTIDPAQHDDPLIRAAWDWFAAGYAVVPSHEDGSKRPFGPWREYQQHRPTWAEVEGWLLTGRYTGIGVITGAVSGNAELVEIEGPADEAVSRLGAVMAAAGMAGLNDLIATVARGCVEQSAGGGLHMFLRVGDGGAKPNTKLAMTGTAPNRRVVAETRGEGGFVIVAPTPARKGHPDGAAYLFLQGSSPEGTPTVTASERDEVHDLLRWALHDGEDDLGAPTPATPTASVAHVEPTSAFGDYRARTTWRDLLTPLGWREGPTERDGRTHWTRPGGQRFEGTSATTIEDGPMYVFSTNAGLPAERGLSKEYVYAQAHHGGDLRAAGAALRAAGYGQATTTAAPSLAPWQPVDGALPPEVADMTPEQAEAELRERWVREHLPALDWHAIWADDTEEEWIVEPLIAARRLVALYSAPKVGKSILLLEIAAAIATGRGMFGYPPTGGPRRTLYVDFENDPRGDTRARLIDMGYAPDDLANLVMLSFPTLAALDTDDGGRQLMAAVLTYRCELVVIDTVSRSVEGDENENDTWLKFYRSTGLRLKQAGVALVRLDHSGKDPTKGQRGGSAKSGDVDAIWHLRKVDEEVLELECDAARMTVPETKLTLRRLDGPLRHQVDGLAVRRARDELLDRLAQARVPKDPPPTIRQAGDALRAAGITFTKGLLTRGLLDRYAGLPATWTPAPMGDDRG
jgi:hypothetical protein